MFVSLVALLLVALQCSHCARSRNTLALKDVSMQRKREVYAQSLRDTELGKESSSLESRLQEAFHRDKVLLLTYTATVYIFFVGVLSILVRSKALTQLMAVQTVTGLLLLKAIELFTRVVFLGSIDEIESQLDHYKAHLAASVRQRDVMMSVPLSALLVALLFKPFSINNYFISALAILLREIPSLSRAVLYLQAVAFPLLVVPSSTLNYVFGGENENNSLSTPPPASEANGSSSSSLSIPRYTTPLLDSACDLLALPFELLFYLSLVTGWKSWISSALILFFLFSYFELRGRAIVTDLDEKWGSFMEALDLLSSRASWATKEIKNRKALSKTRKKNTPI